MNKKVIDFIKLANYELDLLERNQYEINENES